MFALYNVILTSIVRDVKEKDVVDLSKDTFVAALEKMPHFILFTYPTTSE